MRRQERFSALPVADRAAALKRGWLRGIGGRADGSAASTWARRTATQAHSRRVTGCDVRSLTSAAFDTAWERCILPPSPCTPIPYGAPWLIAISAALPGAAWASYRLAGPSPDQEDGQSFICHSIPSAHSCQCELSSPRRHRMATAVAAPLRFGAPPSRSDSSVCGTPSLLAFARAAPRGGCRENAARGRRRRHCCRVIPATGVGHSRAVLLHPEPTREAALRLPSTSRVRAGRRQWKARQLRARLSSPSPSHCGGEAGFAGAAGWSLSRWRSMRKPDLRPASAGIRRAGRSSSGTTRAAGPVGGPWGRWKRGRGTPGLRLCASLRPAWWPCGRRDAAGGWTRYRRAGQRGPLTRRPAAGSQRPPPLLGPMPPPGPMPPIPGPMPPPMPRCGGWSGSVTPRCFARSCMRV